MKVILFGATGMIGQGVLLECIADPDVTKVLAVGRGPSGAKDPKVEDLVLTDLYDYGQAGPKFAGYDACFFCLGASSAGMSEADYTKITYDLTVAAATAIHRAAPNLTFCFVSGASSGSARISGVIDAHTRRRRITGRGGCAPPHFDVLIRAIRDVAS